MSRLAIIERYFDLPTAMRILVQVSAVIVVAATGSFVVGRLMFSSPLNLIWMVLLPALIGVLLNKGTTHRVTFPVFWVILSFVTVALLAKVAGLGPA